MVEDDTGPSSLDIIIESLFFRRISGIAFETEQTRIWASFPEEILEHSRRHSPVDSILFIQKVDGQEIDITTLAPEETKFHTYSGITGGSRYSRGIGVAVTVPRGTHSEIYFNPDILEYRGGVLWVLHEIGHAWQQENGKHVETGGARRRLVSETDDNRSLEQVQVDLQTLKDGENDAWQFAMSAREDLFAQGINITPLLSQKELTRYPQTVYNIGYNREIAIALANKGIMLPEGGQSPTRLVWEKDRATD